MEDLNLPSGKYSLICRIKSDDKGNVFLAEHKTMGVKRIIKQAMGDEAYRISLMREAYILSRLKHPFIPSVCDIEESDGAFYIIEEYIEGQSLYDYIRKNGIFEQNKGLETGVKLAKIIDFLHSGHSFRVCHLDIQPKNIIIKDNQIYLIDFGNAVCSDDTANACVMATRGFAPPEQYVSGFGENIPETLSADIYGFGAVLLYMLTGVYKEAFEAGETEALLRERLVNNHIINIVSSALNKKADCRQNTMGIICKQLDNAMPDKVTAARAASAKTAEAKPTVEKAITDRGVCLEETPYIISVAGMDRGTGTTYTAILLTALMREKGISAIYEENHDRDTIRKLAKNYSQIKYEKGFFTLNGIIMKPKYNDNIRIHTKCDVIVRDEGTVEECKEAGEYLIIVAQADILGWTGLKTSFDHIEQNMTACGKNISVVLNRCNEEEYRRAVSLISCGDGYMKAAASPFCGRLQDFKGMEAILKRFPGKLRKGDREYEEEHRSNTYRRNTKHRNSFRKKW